MKGFERDLKTTAEIAKKILPRMGELKVPLIPENYRIWFEYYIGSNRKLVNDIKMLIESSEGFTPELNRTLYEKYFGEDQNSKLVEKIQKETRIILKNFLEQVLITSDMTSDYSEKLKTYSEQFDSATDLTEIEQLIENMREDTNTMVELTRSLQVKLEEATSQAESLREELEKTAREALIDSLTGLHNRKAFDRKLQDFFERFKKDGFVFSTIMLDIDHFKNFNDRYGHKIGDEVLKVVGSVMLDTLKGQDFPARYGGEEFVVLLPKTSLDNASILAEQIRTNIAEKKLKLTRTGEQIGRITVSLGVSQINVSDTADSVIERADKSLYLAKKSGRDNVKSEKDL